MAASVPRTSKWRWEDYSACSSGIVPDEEPLDARGSFPGVLAEERRDVIFYALQHDIGAARARNLNSATRAKRRRLLYNQQLVNISFTAGYNMVGPTLPHSGNSSRQFTQGNWLQGVLLVMGSWCTVLAAGALAPVLPQIGGAFPNTSAIDFKVGLLATAPALGVALSAIPLGRLADRIGLSLVLLSGLLLYGVAGVLPFFSLQSIEAIIGTRLLVGLGEAAVMLTSTAMLGLFFSGASRARWIAAQAVSANILGIAILLGGGILGLYGWREVGS